MEEPTSTEFSEPEEPQRQAPPPPTQNTSKLNSNFYSRTRSTILMLVGFVLILGSGQIYSSLLVFVLNVLVFMELNSLKRNEEKQINIPMTKYINWLLFLIVNYYCFGLVILSKFPILGVWYPIINILLTYHNFVCFGLSIFAFLCFVLSLKQGYLKYQFRLFGWIVLATILVSYQGWLLIHNIFQGIFFYIVPSLLVIINDIFAYIFGYFFGKTKLIALSPKKTWEGYIGGAVSTFLFSLILTSALQNVPGITCPMRQPTLVPFNYPTCNEPMLEYISIAFIPFQITKMQAHVLMFSLFASIIGPFGGFFASGLKRSIKIKDFANIIPGHGGVSDRMDCQVIMGSFTYFYIHSIIRLGSHSLAYWLGTMSVNDKLAIYNELGTELGAYGLI